MRKGGSGIIESMKCYTLLVYSPEIVLCFPVLSSVTEKVSMDNYIYFVMCFLGTTGTGAAHFLFKVLALF